ncbi:uncharacterized protein LOC110047502 [Orbicella faveolata]|uniref:uncharacterized protein LOC110047502 n=1 Tax=Orbicella faveolata TaxID=48498 RepID=UPI0009E30A8F|nr:uncharacterized protein LOC110047502 [Orbicella faveolata]
MDKLNVKELKNIARERGIRGYSRLRKAELIEALGQEDLINLNIEAEPLNEPSKPFTSNNILDEPIPKIDIPVLVPSKPQNITKVSQLKNITAKASKQVNSEINKFADWIISHVPEPFIKKNVDKRVNDLKDEVSRIFEEINGKFGPKERKTALRGYFKTYRVEGVDGMDEKTFINSVRQSVMNLVKSLKPIKVKLVLAVNFYKENPDTGNTDFTSSYFHSKLFVITEATDLSVIYNMMTSEIFESLEEFKRLKSGWIFNSVEDLYININPYNPLSASSYIPLPCTLPGKKAIINVKNMDDNECFKWAVTSAVFPREKNAGRLNKRMREDSEKFDWAGIEFPASYKKDIDKFEKQNDYAINVIGYEEGFFYPLRVSKRSNKMVINLLFISNKETNHYCWIKNMSRLMTSKVSNHNGTRHFCYRCLNSFHSEKSLKEHKEYCDNNEGVKPEMPMVKDDKGEFLEPKFITFNNFHKKQRVPFVVYADFECFTEKIDTCQPIDNKSFTNQYQKHVPSGFRYLIKCFDNNIFSPKFVKYTKKAADEDIPQLFIESLEKDIKDIYKRFKFPKKMVMTKKDKIDFVEATRCHICEEEILEDADDKNYKKVRDHCHLTGKYRGAAHNKCNLNYRLPKFFPIIFHNLSGYDSHLFIKNLGVTEGKIDCIPNNEEKYISFTKEVIVDKFINQKGEEKEVKRDLRFIDSFKFMATSLDKLVKNLPKESFKNLSEFYKGEQFDLLMRKGVFPYDWFDSFDKLSQDHLPPIESFYSTLNGSGISKEDYQHAQKVWKTFNMKTMRDYHDLYLETDVLLLTDVFENFRDVCLENYGLDPAFYYTAPGLAWDACLKITKVRLELLSDYDMLMMVEKGIRGGVSMISTRYGKANNPYMEDYDSEQPTKFITYLDANNLYGRAMSKPLPTDSFRFMTKEELKNWWTLPCILVLDKEYPKELHDLHNDYPLAPERVTVNNVEKLIPNLNDKTKYVIHHETLKQYLSLGLKITKIHRGITFKESAWLKPYIDLNTNLRAKATNDFEKDFFKLMNNSVFGKTMENIRNRVDVRLVTTESQAKKLICKPNYQHHTIFSENLVAVHMKKTRIYLNKPVYLGMSILDLSKTLMYDFHYNYIKPKYGENAKLLFTDTDSLAYEIVTDDFYRDISGDVKEKFDTSNYPKNHPSGIETGVNKKVIGMFKDEAGGKQIVEFVGLRAKLYSYRLDEEDEVKKCKGVKEDS